MSVTNEMKMEYFHIPKDIKHDHSPESLSQMKQGIELIKKFLSASGHDHCMEHVLTYVELNTRFFFMAHLVDKDLLKEAYDLFIYNMMKLFINKINEKAGS